MLPLCSPLLIMINALGTTWSTQTATDYWTHLLRFHPFQSVNTHRPGPNNIELLQQQILLTNFLLSMNMQDTSHKLCMSSDTLTGILFLLSIVCRAQLLFMPKKLYVIGSRILQLENEFYVVALITLSAPQGIKQARVCLLRTEKFSKRTPVFLFCFFAEV